MILSIVIPAKNEAGNIGACIEAVKWVAGTGEGEIIVVDNNSTDNTAEIARGMGVRVIICGPERSAQRNRGAREASGEYVFFVDADMRVHHETLAEILGTLKSDNPPDALYVRENIAGAGYWNRVRNFERSFYDATCIDGLRVIRRSIFLDIGGYDEALYAAEDWDLDRRIKEVTKRIALTRGALFHDEGNFSLWRNLGKKNYYFGNIHVYIDKWGNDDIVRQQCGFAYRFWTVFMENGKWKRAIKRPDLMICVWLYRVFVGIVFAVARFRQG